MLFPVPGILKVYLVKAANDTTGSPVSAAPLRLRSLYKSNPVPTVLPTNLPIRLYVAPALKLTCTLIESSNSHRVPLLLLVARYKDNVRFV